MNAPDITADEPRTRRKAGAQTGSVVSRRILVQVDRDMTDKAPRVIWAHELPILEAIFGEGTLKEIEPSKLDEGYTEKIPSSQLIYNKQQDKVRKPSEVAKLGYVFTGDPRAEFDRLVNAYGRHPDVNEAFVEHVYGRFQTGTFSQTVGRPTMEDLPDGQIVELIEAFGFIPVLTDKPTDSEREAYQAARKRLYGANRAQLLKLAEEVGVELV